MEPGVHLKLDSSSQSAIDAFVEYKRIVGDDDNGVLFSPEEYEEYKRTVLPKRLKNRVYVSWTNSNGMDCKLVGPETKCFCQHRYREHQTDFDVQTATKPFQIPCKDALAAHLEHRLLAGVVKWLHHTIQLWKPKRKDLNVATQLQEPNHPMQQWESIQSYSYEAVPKSKVTYPTNSGITGFSSLLDGYLRLDDSGIGAPPKEMLEQPTTSADHPFLRALDPYGKPAIQGQCSSIRPKKDHGSHSRTGKPGVSSLRQSNPRR